VPSGFALARKGGQKSEPPPNPPQDTDFLVLGISGYSKAKLGSISEECVTYSRCTCIVVKDPREVSTQRSGGKREL